MRLAPGTRIGAYEILAPLGAGGMGEVYRARDSRLNRDVAVKVLPEAFSKDPDHYARFQREAQALAALNHPNIAAIYGLEENALIMELVDGETLRTPLPVETALVYARQIAEALEYAHDRNIIHRDLKPANVMITREGVVKVLDFGLAKVVSAEPQAPSPNSPTLTMRATEVGLIMGTASYMSPEQASGLTVDKRADIWSFGVVLWEMLCGGMLFQGQTVSHTLADVIKGDIDLSKIPAGALRDLVGRCLDRDIKNRLRDIGEARVALAHYKPGVVAVEAKPVKFAWLPWAIAALALAAAGADWWRATRPVELKPLIRLNAEISPGLSLNPRSAGTRIALSPDGTRIAMNLNNGSGPGQLHTRILRSNEATALAGTEGAANPFFSPDGRWIGFFDGEKLKKVSLDGGSSIALCEAQGVRGAAWLEDGTIVAALSNNAGLSRIPDSGGTPAPLTTLRPGERTHRQVSSLPGGKAVLFINSATANFYDEANIEVVILATGERKHLLKGGHSPRFMDGHLLYVNGNTLFAAPFDPVRLTTTGTAAPLLSDVSVGGISGGVYASAFSGNLVYLPGAGISLGTVGRLHWVDAEGKSAPLTTQPKRYTDVRISPDGKFVASIVSMSTGAVWVHDLSRATESRVSFLGGLQRSPVWTPDSQRIFFASGDPNQPGIYAVRADGSEKAVRLTDGKNSDAPVAMTPDGKNLLIRRLAGASSSDIFITPIERKDQSVKLGDSQPFIVSQFRDGEADVSPDGRWVAYESAESGQTEVYVRPISRDGVRWQISADGGLHPRWSRDGRELFFAGRDSFVRSSFYRVNGESFVFEKPREWKVRVSLYNGWDVTPDGKRIITIAPEADGEPRPRDTNLTFLINFNDELKRRLANGR